MSKRLVEADSENGLAAFIHASHLLEAGQADAAIQMLRSSTERPRMDHFGIETQLLTDEAYGAASLAPSAAKLRNAFNLKASYRNDAVTSHQTLCNKMRFIAIMASGALLLCTLAYAGYALFVSIRQDAVGPSDGYSVDNGTVLPGLALAKMLR